jgi:hypothetical protein
MEIATQKVIDGKKPLKTVTAFVGSGRKQRGLTYKATRRLLSRPLRRAHRPSPRRRTTNEQHT